MTADQVLLDPGYPALKAEVLELTGLDYYLDKDRDLAAHLARRFQALELEDCAGYRAVMTPAEVDRLVNELTIGETYFFRQPEHFAFLRSTILPDLLERNAVGRQIRIWSAGCATGAEPYSLAILLSLDFAARLTGWDVSITGTDLNTEYLRQARAAVFSKWALREVDDDLRQRCFEPHGTGWRLRDEYRQMVTFERHNLVQDRPPATDFDLVLCRNVLIYFSRSRIERVVTVLRDGLKPGGWLLVGHAEPSSSIFYEYELVHAPAVTAYRRRGASKSPEVPAVTWTPPEWTDPPPVTKPLPESGAQNLAAPRPVVSLDQIRLLADRGDWLAAEALCRRYLAAHSVEDAAYLHLGLILEHLNRLPEALEAFRRAIYLNRNLVLAHYHLGQCQAATRDHQRARKSYGNVLQLLSECPDEQAVPDADGMRVDELRQLTVLQLEHLESR